MINLSKEHSKLLPQLYPREYAAYLDMIAKCYDPKHPDYPEHGGKGVKVCPAWRKSFKRFMADVGPIPD